ncbi:hypothetical protein [Burkholderia sp. BCC1047]|uniref:hypothetical protein n=1 Tax=Burkholderia sp. BCC1047 TaxID=2676299 RepID=UPI001589B2DC|nr:hypothetical protein [Burkholderia sp. BCC1047]
MSENTKIEWCDSTPSAPARINPATGRPGPAATPARDGDKVQARQRVNVEVRTGRRPHPNDLPCVDCGHIYAIGERRHEYDHHLGYAAEHHLDVQAVCTSCHAKRDSARANQTHCIRGHAFDEQNTYVAGNGTRHCRACMKLREKARAPRGPEYWARVNAKRRGKRNG